MEFRTPVDIPHPLFQLEPQERMLCVGSCFADRMGSLLHDDAFLTTVNPYGVMYNPASILHSVRRILQEQPQLCPDTVLLTMGTNHVYRLKENGEIVDNCQKRPAALFRKEALGIGECVHCLRQTAALLTERNPRVNILLTVSPIRYAKYGYHGSQLSKATLLLAAECVAGGNISYFPAYEIVQDELRDYRFYAEDMLHPSPQAVTYIYERFAETYFSDATHAFLREWRPLRAALAHRPLHPESEEYRQFLDKTMLKIAALSEKYPNFALPNK